MNVCVYVFELYSINIKRDFKKKQTHYFLFHCKRTIRRVSSACLPLPHTHLPCCYFVSTRQLLQRPHQHASTPHAHRSPEPASQGHPQRHWTAILRPPARRGDRCPDEATKICVDCLAMSGPWLQEVCGGPALGRCLVFRLFVFVSLSHLVSCCEFSLSCMTCGSQRIVWFHIYRYFYFLDFIKSQQFVAHPSVYLATRIICAFTHAKVVQARDSRCTSWCVAASVVVSRVIDTFHS